MKALTPRMMYLFAPLPILATCLLTSQFAYGSPPLKPRGETDYPGPLAPEIGTDMGQGVCADKNDYSSVDKRDDIWFHGHGGSVAEVWLSKKGHDRWVQNIWKTMFPNADPSQFDCTSVSAKCTIDSLECKKDFDSRWWPSAFYLLSAMQNIRTFINEYIHRLESMKSDLTTSLPILADDFGANVESQGEVNFFAVLAGALGMAAGATAANPLVSGTFGAMGAFSAIIGNTAGKPNDGKSKLGKAETEMAKIVNGTIDDAMNNVGKIADALFGVPGSKEEDIPKGMFADNPYGYTHQIPQVLERGQWLLDNPSESLGKDFKDVEKVMLQALGWKLLQVISHIYLIIVDNIVEGKCKEGNSKMPDLVWDPDLKVCFSIVTVTKNGPFGKLPNPAIQSTGDGKLTKPLWEKYGADRLDVFRNAYDCWTTTKGKPVDIDLSTNPQSTPKIKRCFFAIEMKRGSYADIVDGLGSSYMNLNTDFPNFAEDSYTKDSLSGQLRAPHCQSAGDECKKWPLKYDYNW